MTTCISFGESVYNTRHYFPDTQENREYKAILESLNDFTSKESKIFKLQVLSSKLLAYIQMYPSKTLYRNLRRFVDELEYNVRCYTNSNGEYISDIPPTYDIRNYEFVS